MRSFALALAVTFAACNASTGTLTIELATTPGSTLLSSIERIRLTLANPPAVFEAERTADGLDLAFELEAVGDSGVMWIEGFDASDVPIAAGQSPPFPLGGNSGTVVIFVAQPFSILPAPVALEVPRAHIGATDLLYGAVLAGGLDASGAPTASMHIYNMYSHAFQYGEDMPVQRASVALGANDAAGVYVFGGLDESAAPTSTLYRFQANINPGGVYADLGEHPGLESSGQRAVKIGGDAFFVTGTQPALISASTITPIAELADVAVAATAAAKADGTPIAAFLREGIYAVGTFELDGTIGQVDLPTVEPGRAIVAGNEPGTVIVVGGASHTVFVVDLTSGTVVQKTDTLSAIRRSPAVATTSRHIVIAGGTDDSGALVPSADILDASTHELIATVPIEPRTNAIALAMPNDQIMIVGGDEVTNLIELFTPPVPSSPARP